MKLPNPFGPFRKKDRVESMLEDEARRNFYEYLKNWGFRDSEAMDISKKFWSKYRKRLKEMV